MKINPFNTIAALKANTVTCSQSLDAFKVNQPKLLLPVDSFQKTHFGQAREIPKDKIEAKIDSIPLSIQYNAVQLGTHYFKVEDQANPYTHGMQGIEAFSVLWCIVQGGGTAKEKDIMKFAKEHFEKDIQIGDAVGKAQDQLDQAGLRLLELARDGEKQTYSLVRASAVSGYGFTPTPTSVPAVTPKVEVMPPPVSKPGPDTTNQVVSGSQGPKSKPTKAVVDKAPPKPKKTKPGKPAPDESTQLTPTKSKRSAAKPEKKDTPLISTTRAGKPPKKGGNVWPSSLDPSPRPAGTRYALLSKELRKQVQFNSANNTVTLPNEDKIQFNHDEEFILFQQAVSQVRLDLEKYKKALKENGKNTDVDLYDLYIAVYSVNATLEETPYRVLPGSQTEGSLFLWVEDNEKK